MEKKLREKLYQMSNSYDDKNIRIYYQNRKSEDYKQKITSCYSRWSNYVNMVVLGKLELPFLGLTLTTKCSLRCKHCADLIPMYGKNACHYSADETLKDLQKVLDAVNKIHMLVLGGGEIFLYPELGKVLDYCVSNKKIKTVCLITNGTIKPSKEILERLNNDKIIVRVSNYGNVVPNRQKLIHTLKQEGIIVENLRKQVWYDIGDMSDRHRTKKELIETYNNCGMKNCHHIHNGKIWYCTRQRGSELGLMPPQRKKDYVEIVADPKTMKKNLVEMYNRKFIMTCNYCDGNYNESKKVVPGEQM